MVAKSKRRRVGSLYPESVGSVGKVEAGKSRGKVGQDKSHVAAIGRTKAVPADADSSGEPWKSVRAKAELDLQMDVYVSGSSNVKRRSAGDCKDEAAEDELRGTRRLGLVCTGRRPLFCGAFFRKS